MSQKELSQKGSSDASHDADSDVEQNQSFVESLWGVRYQVKDV